MKNQLEAVQKSHFGKLEYWERRYTENDKPFDWYQTFETLRDIITQFITQKSRILNIGCGNSLLSEDMFKEGYQNIINLDFSKVVVVAQAIKYRDYPNSFKFVLADARELPYEDESFDCVLDKGLLDSVLSGDCSNQNSKKIISQAYRVLNKKNGVYIVISHGFPEDRLPYLVRDAYKWQVTVHKIYKPDVVTNSYHFDASDKNNYHFVYVCRIHNHPGPKMSIISY